jgi:hypothetical protein
LRDSARKSTDATWTNKSPRQQILGGGILYKMTFYSKYTMSLTFENLSQHLSALQDMQRERGKKSQKSSV